jgi:hypothetical protein
MTACVSLTESESSAARKGALRGASRTAPALNDAPSVACYTRCYSGLSAHMGGKDN